MNYLQATTFAISEEPVYSEHESDRLGVVKTPPPQIVRNIAGGAKVNKFLDVTVHIGIEERYALTTTLESWSIEYKETSDAVRFRVPSLDTEVSRNAVAFMLDEAGAMFAGGA